MIATLLIMLCSVLYTYRIKFHEESSTFSLSYYNADKQLPIFSKTASGYGFGQLIEILMTAKIESTKICTVRPTGVSENATFVVNLDAVRFGDLKSDDLGSWNATGTKSTFFRMTDTGIKVAEARPACDTVTKYHVLTRRYYVHSTYNLYRRMICDVKGKCRQCWIVLPVILHVGGCLLNLPNFH